MNQAIVPKGSANGPDFSQPIAALKHCHDRIRRELLALQALQQRLMQHGADLEAQQAAAALLRYFDQAAPTHHADEEEDLIPMLQGVARGADAALLHLMLPALMTEHRQMVQLWQPLQLQLKAVALGTAAQIDTEQVQQFSSLYAMHMDTEETHIATMAKRLFDPARMDLLGNAMRVRRGIAIEPNQLTASAAVQGA